MLANIVTGPSAWQTNTLQASSRWYHHLSPPLCEALAETIADLRRRPRPATELRLADTPCAPCAADLQAAREELETGRGFIILRGLPDGDYSVDERKAMYWLVGQTLGRPMAQNVQGTLLYDVADYGQDVRQGARFSVTSAESSFHTDNSFGEDVADYVGLLCLNPARSGGMSQLVSGWSVHNRLLQDDPASLAVLYERFHVDRRGGVRPGDASTIQFPVIGWDGRDLLYRYFRYWIEVGQDKVGQPLTHIQRRALDALDQAASSADLRAEFALVAGDMFFINNRWLLHNRTAFEDHPEPQRRRHLVRLWLRKESP